MLENEIIVSCLGKMIPILVSWLEKVIFRIKKKEKLF